MADARPLPRIKVCGVRTHADVESAVKLGLGAVGFVSHPASPRHVSFEQAAAVVSHLPLSVWPVVVLVDRERALAEKWIAKASIGAVQLCGHELPAQWEHFPVPLLRRIGVNDDAEREIDAWRAVARGFVLDHPDAPGGSGASVDLERAALLARLAPCLLAGGLDAQNVAERVARVRPHGVDASSHLESAPGRKDRQRVADFVAAAAAALALVHGDAHARDRGTGDATNRNTS